MIRQQVLVVDNNALQCNALRCGPTMATMMDRRGRDKLRTEETWEGRWTNSVVSLGRLLVFLSFLFCWKWRGGGGEWWPESESRRGWHALGPSEAIGCWEGGRGGRTRPHPSGTPNKHAQQIDN
jgi:hypothetical protein